jgi:hypothetical protein
MSPLYNTIICEVLKQHRNYIETGNMLISAQDLITANKQNQLKKLNKQQKETCNLLLDIERCFYLEG